MAARARVDGADVEAGAAADAGERLAADLVGEHVRAAVVEQHDVEVLRPVARRDAGPERRVRVHALAGRRARQQLEEDLEILGRRDQLLDPDDGDQRLGQRRAEAAVALRLDDRDGAGLGDREVGAADRDARGQELRAQVRARRGGELLRVVREPGQPERAAEEVADLDAVLVDRRDEDVRRLLAGELDDQLGEVGLDDVDARAPRAPRSARSRPSSAT